MKQTKEQVTKRGISSVVALVIIAVAVYFGFEPLFDLINGGVAGSVVGAAFSSIFVIVLTMYLLNKQTEIEQESKKSERVFDEKVSLYKDILVITQNMIQDGQITMEEVSALPFTLMRLQMLGSDEAIENFEKVFSIVNSIFEKTDDNIVEIDEAEKLAIYKEMLNFTVRCRVDLGVSDHVVKDELFNKSSEVIERSSALVNVRGGGDAKAVYRSENDFFKVLQDRGFDNQIITLTNTILDKLNNEFSSKDFDINFVATSTTSTPQISIRKDDGSGKMNKIGGCYIRKNSIIARCWRSPRWDYKQLKVDNLEFLRAKKFSFENQKLSGGPSKYMPVLNSQPFTELSERELNGFIFLLKETYKIKEAGTVLNYTKLVNAAESGDEDAILEVKKIISEDFIHELTNEELNS